MMSDVEVITILICFHINTYRNFKHFYIFRVCQQWKHMFPKTFSYNRFAEIMPRCFVVLTMFLRLTCFGECTGISFVDSTCIPVIHNKCQFNMRVFNGIASSPQSRKSITKCLTSGTQRDENVGILHVAAWVLSAGMTND